VLNEPARRPATVIGCGNSPLSNGDDADGLVCGTRVESWPICNGGQCTLGMPWTTSPSTPTGQRSFAVFMRETARGLLETLGDPSARRGAEQLLGVSPDRHPGWQFFAIKDALKRSRHRPHLGGGPPVWARKRFQASGADWRPDEPSTMAGFWVSKPCRSQGTSFLEQELTCQRQAR